MLDVFTIRYIIFNYFFNVNSIILQSRLDVTDAIVIVAEFESIEAAALERSHSIETSTVVAHVLMTTTLVYVHARVASCREGIPVVADTLKTTVQVRAFAISTYPILLVALVHI